MYKACIFDLDGTLTDTLESITFSVNQTLDEMKLPSITNEQCRSFVGNGARYLMERALEVSGGKVLDDIEQAMKIYGRVFQENCTYHVVPYEGIIELLQTLKAKDMKLCVLSNKPHKQAVHVVQTIFGNTIFCQVQGQLDEIPRKPDPAAALLLAKNMQILPEECLYIGDSDVDMKTGNAAGMTTIGVSWGFRTREVLQQHGAHHIIDQPNQLLSIIA